MVLAAFTDGSFSPAAQTGEMTVYINPEQYTQSNTIVYDDTQAQGSSAGSPDYNRTLSEVLTFQLIFDGTGVVPTTIPGIVPYTQDGIVTQLNEFMQLAFNYDSDIHSPNFIQLSWGTLVFNCRLSTLNITYTLFKPDGTPLRAKADVKFIEYQAPPDTALDDDAHSPDMSRVVTVRGGDTLPLLCYDIYGSSVYYTEIARINGMDGFRELIPGTQILFPPLSDSTS
jgi:hypothetical protein